MKLSSYFPLSLLLHALRGPWHHQLQPNVHHTGGHVGERNPEELGIPAGAVSGSGVGSCQGVLHAVGHFGEVRVTDAVHYQSLDLDIWK